jgi:pyrroline-5-carboxylate reductase
MLEKWNNTGIKTTTDNIEVCEASELIVFAVKPNVLPIVMKETKAAISNKMVVSIAAGVMLKTMEDILGNDAKIVRAMPNTPAQVGCGITVLSPNTNVSKEEFEKVKELFSGAGSVVSLEEKYINAATALHGSSPAYVYMLIDAMADSGVKHGIPKDISIELAAKAVEGAAKMVLETSMHPSALKDAVCSPGGTTIAAVWELEKGGFSATVSKAIDACVQKADEMSKN